MGARYVIHDDLRWKVTAELSLDGEPAYQLTRRTPHRPVPFARCVARMSDCEPAVHEPIRTLRDANAVLRYNVARRTVTLSAPRSRDKITTTLGGLLHMALRARAAQQRAEREFKRRTRRRG